MKKILKAYSKDIFDISEPFISVSFLYNKEAVKILDEQINGGVTNTETLLFFENALLDVFFIMCSSLVAQIL